MWTLDEIQKMLMDNAFQDEAPVVLKGDSKIAKKTKGLGETNKPVNQALGIVPV